MTTMYWNGVHVDQRGQKDALAGECFAWGKTLSDDTWIGPNKWVVRYRYMDGKTSTDVCGTRREAVAKYEGRWDYELNREECHVVRM